MSLGCRSLSQLECHGATHKAWQFATLGWLEPNAAEDVIVADMQNRLTQIWHLALQGMVSVKVLTDTGCCCRRLTSVKVSNTSAAGLLEIRSCVPETGWDPYTSWRAAYADTA